MTERFINNSPVAIGGVGGSGTRVVARILVSLGYYMGDDLNNALDNLSFTFLFKRPKWFMRNRGNLDKILRMADVFRKSELSTGRYSFIEYMAVFHAMAEWFFNAGRYRIQRGDVSAFEWWKRGVQWAWKRFIHIVGGSARSMEDYKGWGWKEPNTHVFLEQICRKFSDLKYIHVIRHGLDMALSKHRSGVFLWGSLYGVEVPVNDDNLPAKMLRYWYAANSRAIESGHNLLGRRFFLLNFDKLCVSPEEEIKRLVEFLEIECSEKKFRELCSIPQIPASSGRYRDNIGIFNEKEMEMVREFGFVVE